MLVQQLKQELVTVIGHFFVPSLIALSCGVTSNVEKFKEKRNLFHVRYLIHHVPYVPSACRAIIGVGL